MEDCLSGSEHYIREGAALFLRGHLMIGIAPRADLQAPAHPAKIFLFTAGGSRSG